MTDLRLVPVTRADAINACARWHRHNPPATNGILFQIGVASGDALVAVAIVGIPVARHLCDGRTLEVRRVATDCTPHAASMLYGACWRASKALGYTHLITYTQGDEPGTSLRAAGWRVIAERPPRPGWSAPSRPRDDRLYQSVARTLWEAA
jgi:hypothetical protein